MSSRLVACASCGRHVFASEAKCPFCASALSRRVLASVVTGLTLLGCPKDPPKAEPDAAVASASASASPPAPPSASDDGAIDLGNLQLLGHSDGGLLRERAAVYGPARTTNADGGLANTSVRGECNVASRSATVPITNAERVLAGLRPRFRAIYNQGLQSDPLMAGTFAFTADVAADGTVGAVDAGASKGLSPAVTAGMTRVLKNAVFEAPGKPSRLTGTVTCTTPK